jgi:hypothetical protein
MRKLKTFGNGWNYRARIAGQTVKSATTVVLVLSLIYLLKCILMKVVVSTL